MGNIGTHSCNTVFLLNNAKYQSTIICHNHEEFHFKSINWLHELTRTFLFAYFVEDSTISHALHNFLFYL